MRSASSQPGLVSRDVALRETGLELLRGFVEGRHPAPPYAVTSGCFLVEVEDGRAVFEGEPTPEFLNPLGTVHGGWTAGIMDSAMACAVHSTLTAGRSYTTLEYRVHLVRAILPSTGRVRCEGRVVHRGATVSTSEATLRDGEGRLLAHGTETCLIFDSRERASQKC